ncbi:MAG: hypothetical protein FWD83_02785 [Promicromonosporaceae bacterium]|nr:hypothetical protein [Promicromonosporaceae bacterium]
MHAAIAAAERAGAQWAKSDLIAIGSIAASLLIAIAGYAVQQTLQRRATRHATYAEALRATEDYMEVPYRILRRADDGPARLTLTESISDIQSRIAYHQALLDLHAPKAVSDGYRRLVSAARQTAGPAMHSAWTNPPITDGNSVSLGEKPFDRTEYDSTREEAVSIMCQGWLLRLLAGPTRRKRSTSGSSGVTVESPTLRSEVV